MDVLKFLQNKGNITPNPDYNPKTKKGALEPPYLVDYNPGTTTSDKGRTSISNVAANRMYDLNAYNESNYSDYNVYVNPFDTEEELNKERAENQGALEQLGNMVVQGIGSEVVVGTLRGFSDIVDAGITLANKVAGNNTDNDYTNEISETFAGWQDAIREKFAIYQENPDQAFNFSDFGWYTNGLVSIASTLGLLIPGTAVSKVGSLIGINKLGRGVGKMIGYATGKPSRYAALGEVASKQITTAIGMRTAENYIEARDTYTTVYDEIKNKLSSMDDKQKEEFFNDNPKLKDKTDEDIAKYLAGESADTTFANDFWLTLLDAYQLKALSGIWKNSPSISATSQLTRDNLNAARRLVGKASIENPSIKKALTTLPTTAGLKTIGAELSEGFEEAWQYAMQQYGIDVARNAIDKQYKVRSIEDNLTDPMMWENAFWGWIGGVAFQGLASAGGRAWNKYVSKAKDSTYEARKAEIDKRAVYLNDFNDRMRLLNNNFDPDTPMLNEDGSIQLDASGNRLYESISDTTRDAKKSAELDKLITNLTLDAADAGNFDLLKDFVSSEEFSQYINNNNVLEENERKSFLSNIVSKMDAVYETYSNEVNKIAKNDIANPSIIQQIAKENTYNKLASNEEQFIIDDYQSQINKDVNNINDINLRQQVSENENAIKAAGTKAELDFLNQQLLDNDKAFKEKKITKLEHEFNKRRINKAKQAFINESGFNSEIEFNNAASNEISGETAIQNLNTIDKDIAFAILEKDRARRRKIMIDSQINDTNDKIKNRADFIETNFKLYKEQLYTEALEQLDNIFENNDVNETIDYLMGNKDANINDSDKTKLDKLEKQLNILSDASESLAQIIGNRARRAQRNKSRKPAATVNGEGSNIVPTQAENAETSPDGNNASQSSTGGQQQAETINETKPVKSVDTTSAEEKAIVSSPVEDESASKAIESVIKKETEELDKQFNASATINSLVLDAFLRNKREDIINATDDEQYNILKQELISQGLDNETIDLYLPKELASIRILYNNLKAMQAGSMSSSIGLLIADELSSNNKERTQKAKAIIDRYTEANNILTIDNTAYINIINMFKWIIKHEDVDITLDTAYKLFQDISQEIRENGINGVKVNDGRNLGISKAKLAQLLQDKDKESIEEDNNVGIYNKITSEGRILLNRLKPNDRLIAVIPAGERGVEFYVNSTNGPVKIGFNLRPERTETNDGFYVTASNGKFKYIITKQNGIVNSNLTDIILALNPLNGEISDENKKVLSLMAKAINETLSNEEAIELFNTDIGKQLLNNHLTDKNPNAENATIALRFISNIFTYEKSDDIIDNINSYGNMLTKFYSNFEMTESIYDNIKNGKDVDVRVSYVTRGEAITNNEMIPQPINQAIVDFNPINHHLGIVSEVGNIMDVSNGNVTIKPGFTRRQMMVIIPNGNNEPYYAEIIPQKVSVDSEIGKDIFDEVNSLISKRQKDEITYDELKTSLMNIFGYKKFINGIICTEYDNRIILANTNDTIPAITIYKYKNNSSELGTGISINPTRVAGQSDSFSGWSNSAESKINNLLRSMFSKATFSMSYDIARSRNPNKYITYDTDGKGFNININGVNKHYNDYLDFIIRNDTGRIKLGKQNLGNGVETNFSNERSIRGNIQLKINYTVNNSTENVIENKRLKAIDKYENINTPIKIKSIVTECAPKFNISNSIADVLFNDEIIFDKNDDSDAYAKYHPTTNEITVTKKFFTAIRDTINGQDELVRSLLHERIHKLISQNNIMSANAFINEMRAIRQEFYDVVNAAEINQDLITLANKNKFSVDSYIKYLQQFVDDNNAAYKDKNEMYILEEFIVESLTNKYLSQALNNITSGEFKIDDKPTNLWSRIINFIRELFGLGKINDNTLLAREWIAFNMQFNEDGKIKNLKQDEIDNNNKDISRTAPTEQEKDVSGVQQFDEDISENNSLDDVDFGDMFSAIGLSIDSVTVPAIGAAMEQLTASEQAKFATSLAAGEINFRCM